MASFAAELESAPMNKGELIRTGYMEKQGEIVKSLKNRYFKLWSNYILEYFKDQSNSKSAPKGIIDLSSTLNMTKSGDLIFEVECPARIWKFKTKTEFSRDSWFDSIYKVWKGIDHKKDANQKTKEQVQQIEDKQKQYGYGQYNYNLDGPDLEYEEGNKVYPHLKIKNSKKNHKVDVLWGDKPDNVDINDLEDDEEEEPEGGHTGVQTKGDDNINSNDSSYGLMQDTPQAPNGFAFHRINAGDTLVSLSVKYNISQNKIKQYNKDMCFGHRLGHITGKLILIPVSSNAVLTDNIKKQIDLIYQQDNKYNLDDLDEKEYPEPDDNGKYALKKALAYHAKGLDSFRCEYYLKAAKWNVRKALKLWKQDDIWEKKQKVMKECELNEDEALILLQNFNWNVNIAIQQRKKYGNNLVLKKMELQNGQNKNPLLNNQQITLQ